MVYTTLYSLFIESKSDKERFINFRKWSGVNLGQAHGGFATTSVGPRADDKVKRNIMIYHAINS